MSELSDEEIRSIRISYYVTNLLSLLGSCFVIWSHLFDSEQRPVFLLQLAFQLSVSDFFVAASALISAFALETLEQDTEQMNAYACVAQAAGTLYFKLVSALWTASIAYSLYRYVVHYDAKCDRFNNYFLSFNWGFPFLCIVPLLFMDVFGPADPFCFITEENNTYRYPFLYGIILGVLVFDIWFYLKIVKGIKRHREEIESTLGSNTTILSRAESKISRRIIHIVTVFIATWTWTFLNRTYFLFDPEPKFWITYLQFFFLPLEGFCNSLIYNNNKQMRRKIRATGIDANHESPIAQHNHQDPQGSQRRLDVPLQHSPRSMDYQRLT
eukprot:TRINITY_DN9944_c0_g1_i2.p1 TRINITY_DN9944_c0_g1~~TRINITY_DN9944_c0_g1_i2.p1  ORF type:complete len:327 (+),score=57.48 TRINITY_DN9944_c0_g1_i2:144-1124(+)